MVTKFNLFKIHERVFKNYVNSLNLSFSEKTTILNYYLRCINENNISEYYNISISIFFSSLCKGELFSLKKKSFIKFNQKSFVN